MLNILTYPVFLLISIVLPRNKKIWVFGCYDGYLENTRFFFEYASQKYEYDCFWLANTQSEKELVQSLGYKSVVKKSLKGFWLSSRAYFSFICTGYSDVNRLLALSSKVINFWHGTPIKKLFFDSAHDLNRFGNNKLGRFVSSTMLRFLISRYSFYYASNELEREVVCKAAKLPLSKSLSLGAPRFDNIRNPKKNNELLNLREKHKKIFLYAPTWRESGVWSEGFNISKQQHSDLNNMLIEKDAILLIKNHPLTDLNEIKSWGLHSSDRIIYSSEHEINDINSIYAHADILITDVSSSMFDYLIFNRPVILFMPDVESYINGQRGIYNYFKDFLLDNVLLSWGDLVQKAENIKLEGKIFTDIAGQVSSYDKTNESIYTDLVDRFL